MRKWFPLLLLAALAYNVAADSFDADCLEPSESACCLCLCQTHFVDPGTAHATPVAREEERLSAFDFRLTQHLADKSLFHPPEKPA